MTSDRRDRCEDEEGCTGQVYGFLCDEPEHGFHDDDTRQYPATDRCTAVCERHASKPHATARIRRIIAGLERKAAATRFPQEAAACRARVKALHAKYRL
jgi:hypothetical protein